MDGFVRIFVRKQKGLVSRWRLIKTTSVGLIRKAFLQEGGVAASKELLKLILNLDIVCMMTRPNAVALVRRCPELLMGDLSSRYIARRFDNNRKLRRQIFLNHYAHLAVRVREDFYEQLVNESPVLWEMTVGQELMYISLQFNHQYRHEGDISLIFHMNHVAIYELSFSIVPGHMVGVESSSVLCIARIQGTKEKFAEIKSATRLCEDIVPSQLLVVGVQAIAKSLDIKFVVGLSNKEQISKSSYDSFPFDYDAFWMTFSAAPTCGYGFYAFSASFSGKPLQHINPVHRRRTRAKRLFKQGLATKVAANFVATCTTKLDLGKSMPRI